MTSRDNRIFMVARAMAKHDGHDPDQQITVGPARMIRGEPCTFHGGITIPLHELYAGLASVAVDEIAQLIQKDTRP
jgi:hypothetical protein